MDDSEQHYHEQRANFIRALLMETATVLGKSLSQNFTRG
jgi:hypothetical protein